MPEDKCKGCHHYRNNYTEHPCIDCSMVYSGRQKNYFDRGKSVLDGVVLSEEVDEQN